MRTRIKRITALLCMISVLVTCALTGVPASEVKATNGSVPDNLTNITFLDFGIVDDVYSKTWNYGTYIDTDIDGVLFSGYVTFKSGAEHNLLIAGHQENAGIKLRCHSSADQLVLIDASFNNASDKFAAQYITTSAAGVNTFKEHEIYIQMSIEYVEHDNDGNKDDLKLGLWVNGNMCSRSSANASDSGYLYVDDYKATHNIGSKMTINPVGGPSGKTMTVRSRDLRPVETMPTNLNHVTFKDFQIADTTYTDAGYKGGAYEEQSNLKDTLFSGYVTFDGPDAYLMLGGTALNTGGFGIATAKDANTGEIYLRLYDNNKTTESYTKFGEKKLYDSLAFTDTNKKLIGEELYLQISVEYVAKDGDSKANDVKLGLWFNGKLYSNRYFNLKDFTEASNGFGTYMTIYTKGSAADTYISPSSVTVKSHDLRPVEAMPTNVNHVTFKDFQVADTTYTDAGYKGGAYEEQSSLKDTLFSGYVTFDGPDAYLIHGGTALNTGGFGIATAKDANTGEIYLRLYDNNKTTENYTRFGEKRLYDSLAFTDTNNKLIGEELYLQISVEYVAKDGDGKADDVKLGLWFNGKLYSNRYFYLKDFTKASNGFGTYMTIYTKASKAETYIAPSSVTVKSHDLRPAETMPTGFTDITFKDFQVLDTTHKAAGYKGATYTEKATLDKTLFTGYVTFDGTEAFMMYGGKELAGGFGISTVVEADGKTYLRLYDTNKKTDNYKKFTTKILYDSLADTKLVGEKLKLQISIEYVSIDGGKTKNDVKLGLWFNGKLYSNRYIYLKNYTNTANGMGTYLTLYTPKTSTSSVTVASIDMRPVEQLPTGLTKLGFKDFGIAANMYESASVKGQYKGKSLDGTLFNGKITFSKEGNGYLMIGGKEPWGGFGLTTAVNEKTGEAYLQLYDTKSGESKARFSRFSFYSSVAGVQLVDKELDLSFSIQYVDRDGDGKKNDIKLGVWFAGVLYNNRYIYLTDYTNTKHSMGTWMTIYATKGATVGVGSLDEWLDFSVYGLTADWETTLLKTDFDLETVLRGHNVYTGDKAPYLPWLTVCGISFMVIILCGYMSMRERKEQE